MKGRMKSRVSLSGLGVIVVLVQLGCSSNQTTSSNSSAAGKPGSETARDNANQPVNANTSEQSAASQSPAGGSTAAVPDAPSPAGPPTGATVPAGSAPSSEQAGTPQPAAPEPPPPRTYTLPSGRSIPVYTTSTLSTKSNKTGEPITCTLATSIVDGDWVIAQKGATVEGVIVNSDPGGRVKGVASMSVRLNRLTLADGRTIPISTSAYGTQAKTTKKRDAKKIGIGAGAGAVIGAIAGGGKGAAIGAGVGSGAGTAVVLSTRGDPAVIPGESKLSFRLTAAVKITKR
jgi:YMGG-like Gly-zipper